MIRAIETNDIKDEHYAIAAAYGQVSLLSPTVWIGENKKMMLSYWVCVGYRDWETDRKSVV